MAHLRESYLLPRLQDVANLPQWGRQLVDELDAILGELAVHGHIKARKDSGTLTGDRSALNFITGSNVTLTLNDDAAGDEIELTIASTGGGGTTHALQSATHTDVVVEAPVRGSVLCTDATPQYVQLKTPESSPSVPTIGAMVHDTLDPQWAWPTASDQVLREDSGAIGFGPINLTTGNAVTGALTVTNGGTGVASIATNGVPYGNLTAALGVATANATGTNYFLRSVSSGAPAFAQVDYGDLSSVPSTFTPIAHNLLSAYHGDTTTGTVVRGDLVTGQGVTPKWTRLAKPGATGALTFDGTDVGWVTSATQGQVLRRGASAVEFGAVDLDDTDAVTGTLGVAYGGTNLSSGTSGGVLGYTAAGVLASSAALTANALVLGGGAGATPSTPVGLGTATQVLHGNPAGAPTWGAVALGADVSGTLPAANGGTAQNTWATGDLLYASAPNTLSRLTIDTTGYLLFDIGGVPGWQAVGNIDHQFIGNLTGGSPADAGHTQFALLAGRSSGQTLIGGTASGEDLTLRSTADSAKGDLILDDAQQWWPSVPDPSGAQDKTAARFDATITMAASTNAQNLYGFSFEPTTTQSASGFIPAGTSYAAAIRAGGTASLTGTTLGVAGYYGMLLNPAITSAGGNDIFQGVRAVPTITNSVAVSTFGGFQLFGAGPTLSSSTNGVAPMGPLILACLPAGTYSGTTAATYVAPAATLLGTGALPSAAVTDDPRWTNSSTGSLSLSHAAVQSRINLTESGGGTLTATTVKGLFVRTPNISATGTVAITEYVGVDVQDISNAYTTTALSLRSSEVDVEMQHAGSVYLGATGTAASARLHINEPTVTNEVLRLESTAGTTTDDPTTAVVQADVTTTNATVTTLLSYTLTASRTYVIEARVVARRTGGSAGTAEDGAGYVVRGTYKTSAGSATLIGSVTAVYTAESQAAWNATLDTSGAAVRVRVTGAANNNISWHATVFVSWVGS